MKLVDIIRTAAIVMLGNQLFSLRLFNTRPLGDRYKNKLDKIASSLGQHYDLNAANLNESSSTYHFIHETLDTSTYLLDSSADKENTKKVAELLRISNRIDELNRMKSGGYALDFADEFKSEISLPSYTRSPLLSAIKKRHLNMVRAYCEDNDDHSDFYACDSEGNSPLHLSLLVNSPDIFDFLLKTQKLSILTQNNAGNNLLHLSIQQKNNLLFHKILGSIHSEQEKNELVFGKNKQDMTPLMMAAKLGYKDMVSTLLRLHKKANDSDVGLALSYAEKGLTTEKKSTDNTQRQIDYNSGYDMSFSQHDLTSIDFKTTILILNRHFNPANETESQDMGRIPQNKRRKLY